MTLEKILSQAVLSRDAVTDRVSQKLDAVLGRTAPSGRHLTIVGDFDASVWKTTAEEIAAIQAPKDAQGNSKWSPATDDYVAAAAKSRIAGRSRNIPVVGSTNAFINFLLMQPKASITRLNIITHASPTTIALSGEVIEFNVAFDEELSVSDMRNFLRNGYTLKGRQVPWAEVEARFADGAEIAIYACNAALAKSFLQDIAEFFGVRILAFDKKLNYSYPGSALTGGRIDRKQILVEGKQDFAELTPNVVVEPELKEVTF